MSAYNEQQKDASYYVEASNGQNICKLDGEDLETKTIYTVSNNETW